MRTTGWLFGLLLTTALAVPGGLRGQLAGEWALEPGDAGASATQSQQSGGRMLMTRQTFPAKSSLSVRVKGDSAFATWTATEPAAKPIEMRGTVSGQKVALQGSREARVLLNGEASSVVMLIQFELTRTGDQLAGTMRTTTESGQRVLGTLPVKGKLAR